MEKSVDCVRLVFEKALGLVEDRELPYGNRWLGEPILYLWTSVFRKSEGLKHQLDNGVPDFENTKEQLLDLMNYAAFLYLRLEEVGRC